MPDREMRRRLIAIMQAATAANTAWSIFGKDSDEFRLAHQQTETAKASLRRHLRKVAA